MVYKKLKQFAEKEKVQFIVGSSMGGFIGYWLGEDLGLPCLLFNPAMSFMDELMPHMPEIKSRNCPARFVVIGAHDQSVDPQENIRFFRSVEKNDCHQRVLVCEWLAHQIDFNTFDEMVGWALKSYKLFNVKQ